MTATTAKSFHAHGHCFILNEVRRDYRSGHLFSNLGHGLAAQPHPVFDWSRDCKSAEFVAAAYMHACTQPQPAIYRYTLSGGVALSPRPSALSKYAALQIMFQGIAPAPYHSSRISGEHVRKLIQSRPRYIRILANRLQLDHFCIEATMS